MHKHLQNAVTLRRALVAAARPSRLLPPLVVGALSLIFATAADAQSATITLCCDTANGQCFAIGTSDAGTPSTTVKVSTVPTACPESSDPTGLEITIPNVSASVCSGGKCSAQVITYTAEPVTGFVGVCLVPYISYQPVLPTKCYAVKIPGEPNHGYAVVSASASQVHAAYTADDSPMSLSNARPDSYQTLLSCYPHNAHGHCPCPSRAVSSSCCELGSHMTSLDQVVARGYATMAQRAAPQAQCSCSGGSQPNDDNCP